MPPLEEFLQQISLLSDQDSIEEEQELVTLMTLHNAKGLEYDTVFVDRLRGRLLPAHAWPSKRGAKKRSGGSVTSASPAPASAST